MRSLELFRRFPGIQLPFVPLATLPTPLERLQELGDALGFSLWVKRDDLSGDLYGGNKLRKLEFLLGDALKQGHENVWTVGAIGSHHVLATCIWARKLGLTPSALHFPQPVTPHVQKNLKALATTKPNLTLVDHRAGLPIEMFKVKLKEWLQTDERFYYIPGGGSSPLGTVGYVNAALELVAQCEEMGEALPDVVYVAAGTCGTLVGLTLGFALAGVSVEVVGVRVVDKVVCNRPIASRLGNQVSDVLTAAGVPNVPRLANRDYTLDNAHFGREYGTPTEEALSAIRLAAESGLNLEGTYTAKAFAALIHDADRWRDKKVLFWHTLNGVDLTERVAGYQEGMLPPGYSRYLEPV